MPYWFHALQSTFLVCLLLPDLEKWIDNLAKAVRLGDDNAISQWKEVEDTYKQIRNTYPQYFDK